MKGCQPTETIKLRLFAVLVDIMASLPSDVFLGLQRCIPNLEKSVKAARSSWAGGIETYLPLVRMPKRGRQREVSGLSSIGLRARLLKGLAGNR